MGAQANKEVIVKRKYLLLVGAVVALGGGGVATAIATDHDQTASGSKADQAREAALRYTGGGKAGVVEPDTEHGSSWDVEVTKPDGSPVDVRLDSGYKLVEITSNRDG
ncbi:MAG: hypothetical protein QOG09_1480 [Solirubrobacterales bacterium]|jgi:hypothetical protein|nr:hypothetical protein [Solirubrobacterales bacterium]MDX6653012.1 hypothetical protein [Solirubrobacterales bacterium]MDX6663378.1 hypothetical protein [Solirubrobacterales bacterium]